jgi:hypothetical protein
MQKSQSGERAFARLYVWNVFPLTPDTQRGQAKPRGGDACHSRYVTVPANIAAVPHQSRIRIGLFPEVQKRRPLQFL